MNSVVIVTVALIGAACGLGVGFVLSPRHRRAVRERPRPVRSILLPFTSGAISRRALEAAVRLARAEDAVIMPAFLARVPRHLPLDAALPRQCENGMPLLEAIEQRASAQGVVVDARVSRGRTYRDALQRLLDSEHFDRIIVSATTNPRVGLDAGDLQWLLERVPQEVLILRPAADDDRRVSGAEVHGLF